MKYIMQVVNMRLTEEAEKELPKYNYDQIVTWLNQWTCKANIQAVICDDLEQGLTVVRSSFVIPWFIKAEAKHFEFQISWQEIKDNRFWIDSSLILCKWYNLGV